MSELLNFIDYLIICPNNNIEIEKEIEEGKEIEIEKININMANPRRALRFGIKNAESKELLEEFWKNSPESWKHDSSIRKMYVEKKLNLFLIN